MTRLLVTGTDTEIGKTRVTSIILAQLTAQSLRCAGLKPIASGCHRDGGELRNDDAIALRKAASVELPYEVVNRYRFEPPVSPHQAAAEAGTEIDPGIIREDIESARRKADFVLVEGVGGWEVPLSDTLAFSDLARSLSMPVLLVVGIRLGCINHALLTAHAIRTSGLYLAGWVANYPRDEPLIGPGSVDAIRQRLDAPLWGIVPHGHPEKAPDLSAHLIDATAEG